MQMQQTYAPQGLSTTTLTICLLIGVFYVWATWRVFTKAGKPGWAAIIPIYNTIVMLQVAGKPFWWIFLFLIPIANLVVYILMQAGVAKNFGKGTGFALGLILLNPIFLPILAFGSAQYQPQPAA
jgi:hypothetical protein